MEKLVEYNGKMITEEELKKIKEELKGKDNIQVAKLNENTYKTRLLD